MTRALRNPFNPALAAFAALGMLWMPAAAGQRGGADDPAGSWRYRALIAALEKELAEHGPQLPVYWGNRNWHPLLADTLRQMSADGVPRALAFVTSAYSSYSGCRQYRENIAAAQAEVGAPRRRSTSSACSSIIPVSSSR